MSSVSRRSPMAHHGQKLQPLLFRYRSLCSTSVAGSIRQSVSRAQSADISTQPSTSREAGISKKVGEIHLIMGPMFAGKTTTLLQRVAAAEAAGKKVVVVKSAIDTRYSADHVVTHNGDKVPCIPLARLAGLRERLGHEGYSQVDMVAIDEAQFIEDLAESVVAAAEQDGKMMVVAGLSGDFRRQRFGQLLELVPLADRVDTLRGRCNFCDQPSLFTLRIAASTQQELVGGAESYAPVCREHYHSLHRVRETGPDAESEGEAPQVEAEVERAAEVA